MSEAVINGKTYTLSPLRCKHLRRITKMLNEQPSGAGFGDIDKWMPFITECIKVNAPDFKAEELDELTLQEFSETWEKIVSMSGVKLIRGEVKPMPKSTGVSSTEESAPASAGTPTVN